MASSMDTAQLTVHIEKSEGMSPEKHAQLTRALLVQLKSQDVESVKLVSNLGMPIAGAKGDPFTIGAVVIVVIQATLPKVMEFLQAWSQRDQGHTIKMKVELRQKNLEIEYPATMPPDEAKKHLESIMNELGKHTKQH